MASKRAHEYAKLLGREQVTGKQKQVMVAIADYYSERYGQANIDINTICDDVLLSPRQLRRVLAKLQEGGLIEYRPGLGSGNYSQFRFLGLDTPKQKVVEIDSERGHKGDEKGTYRAVPIRKENLNPNPNQIQIPPPPFSKGAQSKQLSHRRVRELNALLTTLMTPKPGGTTPGGFYVAAEPAEAQNLAEAVEIACARLLIPREQAWALMEAAGLGDGRKRCESTTETFRNLYSEISRGPGGVPPT